MTLQMAGVWEVESNNWEGFVTYTDKHFSIMLATPGRQRSENIEPTPEELIADCNAVNAATGTYTVSGSTVTHPRVAGLHSQAIGLDLVGEITVDGDKMTLKYIRGQFGPEGAELSLPRVG